MKKLSFLYRHIEKIFFCCCLCLVIVSVNGMKPGISIPDSLGKYESREMYSHGDFQDYTDYGKYYYTAANVADNSFFSKMQDADMAEFNDLLANFNGWISVIADNTPAHELVKHYDFDRSIIDNSDYINIKAERHTWSNGTSTHTSYTIYFFDTQTQVLYYFHNNI